MWFYQQGLTDLIVKAIVGILVLTIWAIITLHRDRKSI